MLKLADFRHHLSAGKKPASAGFHPRPPRTGVSVETGKGVSIKAAEQQKPGRHRAFPKTGQREDQSVRRHWMPFGVLFVVWSAFLLSFVDRLTWPPIIPLASRDLGISAAQAGGYMTAFYIGYVMTQLPGGYLTDRFGYRKVLLTSFLVMGTFTAAMGLVENYAAGFLLRILAGMGSGAVFSAGVRAIFDWFRQNSAQRRWAFS